MPTREHSTLTFCYIWTLSPLQYSDNTKLLPFSKLLWSWPDGNFLSHSKILILVRLSGLFSINFCYCISQRWLRFCYLIFSHSDVSPFFTPLKTNCKLRMYSKKCNRSTHRPKRDSLRYFKSKVLKMKYLLCPTKFKIPKKKISNNSLKRTNFTKFSSRMEVDMFLRNSNP